MSATVEPRYFFIHVMKTGGASFREHVYANFAAGEVYPVPDVDDVHDAWLIGYLLGQPPERLAGFRAFTGHFPFVVPTLLGGDLRTLSVLRDPVERTISYLKHCKRRHPQHHDLTLEQIYEDPFTFPCLIHNHQAKIFAMTADDKLESYMDVLDIDDRRLALAEENLERVDVLGVHERYGEFVDDVRTRFGWRFDPRPDRRVSRAPWPASAGLRRRIADDNAADVELYQHARRVVERRYRAARSA